MLKAKLGYFFHPVHNLQAAHRFFCEILGLEIVYSNMTDITEESIKKDAFSKNKWLELKAGDVTLLIQEVPSIKPYETGIGFSVDNCDDAYVYLKNSGVEVVSQIQGVNNRVRFFEVKDPSGNTFNIFGK